jgi:hypothetical protein
MMKNLGMLLVCAGAAATQAGATVYHRAPIAEYRMGRSEEIAFARTAAPASISGNAQIMVLGAHGYVTAVNGNNGFVCLVVRAWDQNFDNDEFWNPRIRSPECYNPAGARSVLPYYLKRTRRVLAGESIAEMRARDEADTAAGKGLKPLPDSFCLMMAKGGYTDDRNGHWYPHVMFFSPSPPGQWGANLAHSPIFADPLKYKPVDQFMVVVPQWSDGTWVQH